MRNIPPIIELTVNEKLGVEREKSDKLYAIKRIEAIVFAMIGMIVTAFMFSLISKVIPK